MQIPQEGTKECPIQILKMTNDVLNDSLLLSCSNHGILQSVAKIRNKRKVECFHPEDNSQLFFIANTQDNKNTQIC